MSPAASCTTSPGTRWPSGNSRGCPSRTTVAVTLIMALSFVGGVAGPRFLKKPQADPQNDHDQHHGRSAGIVIRVAPIGNDRQHQQQDHQGVAQAWPKSLIRRNRASFATTLGPCCSRRRAASSSLRPWSFVSIRLSTSWASKRGHLRQQRRDLDRFGRLPESGQDVFGSVKIGRIGMLFPWLAIGIARGSFIR